MSLPASLAELVKTRARGRCEYCQMSQSLQGATFHFDHVVPHLAPAVPLDARHLV